jgi:hypothetical protein
MGGITTGVVTPWAGVLARGRQVPSKTRRSASSSSGSQ